VGGGACRCGRAPQTGDALVGAPRWEAFPEVNRAVVGRLLGLLVERMVTATGGPDGGGRGERGGEAAVGAAGG
jgi:hypothetical protein